MLQTLSPHQIRCISTGNLSFANDINLSQLCKGKKIYWRPGTVLDFIIRTWLLSTLSSSLLYLEFSNPVYFSGHDSWCAFKFSPVERTACFCPSESHYLPAALLQSHAWIWTQHYNWEVWCVQWLGAGWPTPGAGSGIDLSQSSWPECGDSWFPQRISGHTFTNFKVYCVIRTTYQWTWYWWNGLKGKLRNNWWAFINFQKGPNFKENFI